MGKCPNFFWFVLHTLRKSPLKMARYDQKWPKTVVSEKTNTSCWDQIESQVFRWKTRLWIHYLEKVTGKTLTPEKINSCWPKVNVSERSFWLLAKNCMFWQWILKTRKTKYVLPEIILKTMCNVLHLLHHRPVGQTKLVFEIQTETTALSGRLFLQNYCDRNCWEGHFIQLV